jgi:hypothetical protein
MALPTTLSLHQPIMFNVVSESCIVAKLGCRLACVALASRQTPKDLMQDSWTLNRL